MIITIEGMDGAGKTETAIKLANELKFEYIQKPVKMLIDREQEGLTDKVLHSINPITDKAFWAMFLGSAQYYQSIVVKNRNVVLDRYLASNFCNHCNETNIKYFDYLVELCEKPVLTVVLYVTPSERRRRIIKRDGNETDFVRSEQLDSSYEKIKFFLEKYDMNYLWIDATELSVEEVLQRVIDKLNTLSDFTEN